MLNLDIPLLSRISIPPYLLLATLLSIAISPPLRAHAADLSTTGIVYQQQNPNSFENPGFFALGKLNSDNRMDFVTGIISGSGIADTVAVQLQNADGTYTQRQTLTTGDYSLLTVVLADVNGDGKLDIVALCQPTNDFTVADLVVFLGNGDGTFATTPEHTTAPYLGQIAAGDFNGDGKLDIATYQITGKEQEEYKAAIYLSNGDGTFQAPIVNPARLYTNAIQLADINGNGKLDFIGYGDGNISILTGVGNGHLGSPQTITVNTGGLSNLPGSLAIADLNHDQQLDLVVALSTGVGVYLNQGGGTFGPMVTYNTPANKVLTGDVNKDGNIDVVALGGTTAAVLTGSATGMLTPPATVGGYLYGYYSTQAQLADVDGDGKLDIISSSPNLTSDSDPQTIHLVRGVGDGTFIAPWQTLSGTTPSAGAMVNVDVNKDGKRDLVVASTLANTCTLQVMIGNGDGTFTPGASYNLLENHSDSIIGLFSADINKDGNVDLIVVKNYFNSTGSHNVEVLFGNGDGTFQAPVGEVTGLGESIYSAAIGDFNGDGNIDLVLGTGADNGAYSGTVNILTGDGTGAFTQVSSTNVPGEVYALSVADYSGDGKLDVASMDFTNSDSGNMSVLFGDGSGNLTLNANYPDGLYQQSITSADFNGDHHPDIALTSITTSTGDNLTVLLNNGSGVFTQSSQVAITGGALATGDFDGDGKIDLLVASDYHSVGDAHNEGNNGAGYVSLLLGNGNGTFQSPNTYTTGYGPKALVVGNFNSDTKLDVISADFYDGAITSLLNQPTIAAVAHVTSPKPVRTSNVNLQARGKYTAPLGEPGLIYTWSATGPASVTYSVNGVYAARNTTATVTVSGLYAFTCAITDPTGGVVKTTTKINVTLP